MIKLGNDMQEDNFFNELDFATLRDCSGGTEVNEYQVHLDECAIKGKKVFVTEDGDALTLHTRESFNAIEFPPDEWDKITTFDASKSDFVLIGDEYIEGINDPDELEDALNSWGVY